MAGRQHIGSRGNLDTQGGNVNRNITENNTPPLPPSCAEAHSRQSLIIFSFHIRELARFYFLTSSAYFPPLLISAIALFSPSRSSSALSKDRSICSVLWRVIWMQPRSSSPVVVDTFMATPLHNAHIYVIYGTKTINLEYLPF